MTLFTIHSPRGPGALPDLIGHRFSWAAFLFGPLWLASWGRWILAALMLLFDLGAILAAVLGFLSPVGALSACLVAAILLGLEAQELKRRHEARRGRPVLEVAIGSSAAEALARLAERPSGNLEDQL